jgi:phage FluMu protein Com
MISELSKSNQVVNTKSRMAVGGVPVYHVRCPYCSRVNAFHWNDEIAIFGQQQNKVLTCNSDFKEHVTGSTSTSFQGCGRSYAFFPRIEIMGDVGKIKMEKAA